MLECSIPRQHFTGGMGGSTNGCFAKVTIGTDIGQRTFVKLSREIPQLHTWGKESIMEVIVSRIGFALGFNVLKYMLCSVNLCDGYSTIGCISYDYCSSTDTPISLRDYKSTCGSVKESYLQFLLRLGFSKELNEHLILDYIVANEDRHAENIEFLLNTSLKLAPIFDNGKSLITVISGYPEKAWLENIIVNNCLVYSRLDNALKAITCKTRVNRLNLETWTSIFYDMHNLLKPEERWLIQGFVTKRLNYLAEMGLVDYAD